MLWIVLLAWYLFGCFSFQYWWRKDLDLTSTVIPVMLIAGLIGPFAWLMGIAIHGDSSDSPRKNPYVLLKKKE